MPESDLYQRLHSEIRRIIAELEHLLQLPSRWSGQIEIMPESRQALGGKTFGCIIRIRADIAETEARWLTLLHEALHCFSVGRNANAALHYSGYEEGVVERLQMLLRQDIMDALVVALPASLFVDRDANTAYTDYVNALEAMRTALGVEEPRAFYRNLLAAPLEQRWALLHEQARHSQHWQEPDFRRRWRRWERVLSGEEWE